MCFFFLPSLFSFLCLRKKIKCLFLLLFFFNFQKQNKTSKFNRDKFHLDIYCEGYAIRVEKKQVKRTHELVHYTRIARLNCVWCSVRETGRERGKMKKNVNGISNYLKPLHLSTWNDGLFARFH